MADLEKLKRKFIEAKREENFAKKQFSEVKAELITALEKEEDEKYENETERIYLIRASKSVYNWDKVEEAIDPKLWISITRSVPDENLLNILIDEGKIKPAALKGCVETNTNDPYPKVSKLKFEEEE